MIKIARKHSAVILTAILFSTVATVVARAETFVVGLESKGVPPNSFPENDARKGIRIEVLEAVGAVTGDTFIIKRVAKERLLRDFGKSYDIEASSNPAWRPQYQSISVYTKPYQTLVGGVAIRADKSFPVNSVEDLKGKRVGIIRGQVWPDWMPEDGGYTPDWAVNADMLWKKFEAGRYDILLFIKYLAKYQAKERGLDIVFAKEIAKWDISMRLHISKKSALDRLNKALDQLKQDGTIDAIFAKYVE